MPADRAGGSGGFVACKGVDLGPLEIPSSAKCQYLTVLLRNVESV